jgi:tetratricopeptide (TPR) repeat protein
VSEICVTLSDAMRMAVQHHQAGNAGAAEYICRQVLAMDSHQGEALQLLSLMSKDYARSAVDLIEQGNLDQAEAEYCRSIELDPQDPQLQLRLGGLLCARNKPAAAIFTYSETIRRFPDFAPAYLARGSVLAGHRLLNDALTDQRRAIELAPGDVAAHLDMARTLSAKSEIAAAEACCRVALKLDTNSADAWECLGRIMQQHGRFTAAAEAFDRCLQIESRPAVALLLTLMGNAVQHETLDQLSALVHDRQSPISDRISAGFSLGKIFDERDRFDEAFDVFAEANAAFKATAAQRGHRFDAGDLQKKVDAVIETFTADFFRARQSWGFNTEMPVFIVGMPRSGTSLVEQIAASHSRVFGAGERFDIAMIRSRLASMEFGDSPAHWNQPAVLHEARHHTEMLQKLGGGADRVIDKMPGNLMDLGTVATLFPQARIIFCDRDARDTCLSCFFQLFARNDLLFSYDLTDCAEQHRQYDRLTAHWRQVLPLRALHVRYEELVADLEVQSRRLIEFLGLPWEPKCLEFHKTERPVLTSSFWQVRQPIYSRSVGRWKNYEKHLASLQAALSEERR